MTDPDRRSLSNRFLDAADTLRIEDTLRRLETDIGDVLNAFPPDDVLVAIVSVDEPILYHELPEMVFSTVEAVAKRYGALASGRYRKYLVLRAIGNLDLYLERLRLPDSICDLYPGTLSFMLEGAFTTDDEAYLASREAFLREIRLATASSLPCGALIVDTLSRLPERIYRYNGIWQNLKCLWFVYSKLGGMAPIYRRHVELRGVASFDEASVDEAYLRIADLMRLNPHIRGLSAGGWLYDPQLETVSPHLAYQRRRPVENGAYLRYDGPEEHLERAIATSKTRSALYEKGEYVPMSYTFIWPRRDLLRWADRAARDAKK